MQLKDMFNKAFSHWDSINWVYRDHISHFYKAVNYYYNIYKSIAARQVYYKVN